MFSGFFLVRSAINIGVGCIVAPLVLADYKEDDCVQCASPIFMLIAYYLGFTNRKRKYIEEKTTVRLESKQTSIATVRNHLRTLARFPTSLIFHWSLPLKYCEWKCTVFTTELCNIQCEVYGIYLLIKYSCKRLVISHLVFKNTQCPMWQSVLIIM